MLVVQVTVFFKAVSHQLYGSPNNHLDIRAVGIEFMRENPERFIESNTQNSWMEYLTNMALQGTWCDGLIIQAVADSLNLRLHIVESNENFAVNYNKPSKFTARTQDYIFRS